MCEYKLEYQGKEYPFDGRLITKEDKVQKVYFYPNKITVFIDDKNYIRVTGPNNQILIDFDDFVSKDGIYITDEYLVYIGPSLNLQVMDFTGAIKFTHPAVESFEVVSDLVTFKCYCEDGLSRMMILQLEGMDLLTTFEDDIEKFRVSPDGKIFKKAIGYKAVLECDGKLFDHGFTELTEVNFVGNAMALSGYIGRRFNTHVYINDELIVTTPDQISIRTGFNGEIEITDERGKRSITALFNKEGEMLEKFKNGEGEFEFFETGVLCRNIKKNRCMFITGDGVPVYTYDLGLGNICYHSQDFNVASRNYTPKEISNWMIDGDGDFNLLYHVDPKRVPLYYLNNAFRVAYNGTFIVIQKGSGQKYEDYYIDDSSRARAKRNREIFYFTTIVLNNDLKLVISRSEELTNGQKNSLTAPQYHGEMSISFRTEDGEEVYYDTDGNKYDYEPLIGSNGEIYLVIDGNILPYKLPGIPDNILKAFKEGKASLKRTPIEEKVAGEKRIKGLVKPIEIC